MKSLQVAVFCTLLSATCGSEKQEDTSFPQNFKFGVATAAYQVEGAWNASDKGESIWDRLTHTNPAIITDLTNSDVACDSYHLWRRDVEMVTELGVHFYRFSIYWPRLLPTGFTNHISEDGKAYYNNLLDEVVKHGVEPVVTLYHWDLPQKLQDLGGWTNPLIVDWFADYARLAFTLFGDRVKTWVTLNEPMVFCDYAYMSGILAPGIQDLDIAPFLCAKNALLAHAKAWRIYNDEFRDKYAGEISITNHMIWHEPATPEDQEVTELAREMLAGRFSHPIFSKEGGWPPALEKVIEDNSKRLGYAKSRMPAFTQEEKEFVRGTYDFYGFNHYTSRVVRKAKPGDEIGVWPMFGAPELNAVLDTKPEWKPTVAYWNWQNPEGIRHQLAWVKEQYGDVKIFITENGYPTADSLMDDDRVQFYRDYLKQVVLAIKEDGVNVVAYTAWSLMDNFEWNDGFTSKFGLYEVDFSSPNRTRTPRKSAHYYKQVILRNSYDVIDYIENNKL